MRPPPRPSLLFALVVAALWVTAATAGAQTLPPRPHLDSHADPNDWEAYFNLGVQKLKGRPTEAEAAFIWASALAPDRAEPGALLCSTVVRAGPGARSRRDGAGAARAYEHFVAAAPHTDVLLGTARARLTALHQAAHAP